MNFAQMKEQYRLESIPPRYFIGLDLGQANDYTAIAILKQMGDAPPKSMYHLVHLERPPLRTPYPDIVRRVKELMLMPELRGRAVLLVDATGVGKPVVDMIRQAGLQPIAVTITGGNDVTKTAGGVGVPKRNLASILQVMLQTERLKVAQALPEAGVLVSELLNFRVKISVAGHDTYEAWRENAHDDTVLAVAIALWSAERMTYRRPRIREY